MSAKQPKSRELIIISYQLYLIIMQALKQRRAVLPSFDVPLRIGGTLFAKNLRHLD